MNRCIVFLYTELAEYIKACMDRLAETGVQVHVFAYPVNPEAPFQFNFENSACRYYERNDFSDAELEEKVRKIQPQAIVCSGWVDKSYLAVCRKMKNDCRTVLALDTQIEEGIKARLSFNRARVLYKPIFSDAWVPGTPQLKFAQKLGFGVDHIYTGFYTANIGKWGEMGVKLPLKSFPKRFVFVGRYVDFKGVNELWEAFARLSNSGWELFCAGQGPLFPKRKESPGIHHLGFVQPADLDKFVAAGGIFVLPSHKEPWGVVLHEFAAAGYPLISSSKVGAASAFLAEGENGYLFSPGKVGELVNVLFRMTQLPESTLIEMGERSKELASRISIDSWLVVAGKLLETKK